VLAMGPTAIPGTRRPPGLAWSSAGAFVSTALMTAVEPRQPGYLSHSDAATAPVDGFPDRQTLVVGHCPHRLPSASLGVPDESIAFSERGHTSTARASSRCLTNC
jgi:hypothetical protein